MPRILVVEDEEDMAFGLKLNLEVEGYQVAVCHDGEHAIALARSHQPDLMLLDLILPGMQGMDVLQTIRNDGHTFPVIVISGKVEEMDRVAALRLGADDYMVKSSFSLLELFERIKLRLRTAVNTHREQHRLVVDLSRRLARVDGTALPLAPVELDLLVELVRAEGLVLSREELLARVWKLPETVHTHTIEVHVSRLRRKLGPFGMKECIGTLRRVGFYWNCGSLATVVERAPAR